MSNRRILVVDDEPALRMMLAANLELEGFEVSEAASGERALELAKTQKFDLVLTDIRMPGITGVELFRELRGLGMQMPVVLMTAFALEELVQGALEDGAFTVLPKPFDVGHAVRTMSNAARVPVVLVVDDLKNVAESTSEALHASGLRARAVSSGLEALQALQTKEIDLCVVDLVMPGMSGAELAVRVRELDPNVAIIAVSGHEVPEMIRQVANVGMHTFLPKPFAMRELIRSIALARGAEQNWRPKRSAAS